ncbi:unnamed protein product [Bemisia tabaci]|uniref:Uncharacterized protein n=1 Tax=Bemisia tabaci TaxID=7038 RepID=A0A9P0A2K4_BEMTA|nr:unnamed protein product [Bemisia tabaci]
MAGGRAGGFESPQCPAAPAEENSGFSHPLLLRITCFSVHISPKNCAGSLKLCIGILGGSRFRNKRLP